MLWIFETGTGIALEIGPASYFSSTTGSMTKPESVTKAAECAADAAAASLVSRPGSPGRDLQAPKRLTKVAHETTEMAESQVREGMQEIHEGLVSRVRARARRCRASSPERGRARELAARMPRA